MNNIIPRHLVFQLSSAMKTPSASEFLPPGVAGRLDRLDAVSRRSVRWESVARLAGFLVLLAVAAMSFDAGLRLFHPVARWLVSLAVAGGFALIVGLRWSKRRRAKAAELALAGGGEGRNPASAARTAAARAAEESLPDLQERWSTLASVEAECNPLLRGSPGLIAKVREEAAGFSTAPARPGAAVRKRFARAALWAAAGTGLLALFQVADPERAQVLWHRLLAPWSDASLTRIEVVPGAVGAVIPRHEVCELRALVCGRPVREAVLFLKQHGTVTELPLTADQLAAVPFQHTLRDPVEDFAFRFRAGDGQTAWQAVRVADRPVIQAASVTVTPPAYTGQPAEKYPGIPPTLRVLEGSQLTVKIAPGRPDDRVWLMMDGGKGGKLAAGPADESQYTAASLTVSQSARFFPLVMSSEGLENRMPPVCELEVLEDRPPVVALKEDSAAEAITPADTIEVAFSASDDVGIEGAEVLIKVEKAGKPTREIKVPIDLGESKGARTMDRRFALDLSKLPLEPDAKISYAVQVRDGKDSTGDAARKGHPKPGDPSSAPGQQNDTLAKNEKAGQAGKEGKDGKPPGSPEPPDTMGKREMDLGGQCSCSGSRKLEIDGYTGDSPAFREKKSLPVLPVLQKIKESAESALRLTVKARGRMSGGAGVGAGAAAGGGGKAEAALLPDFKEAEGLTAQAGKQSSAFTAMTKGTGYELIGLDLENLRLRELVPAGEALQALPGTVSAPPEADKAAMHLRAAVAWLDRLITKTEKASQAEQAAALAQKLKEMHRIFLEDSLNLLKLSKGENGKVPDLPLIEVSKEYAKMIEKLEKAKAEIMKEFAELLAKDPELLARFNINRSKGADALQVQVASLSMEQDRLNRQTSQLTQEPAAGGGAGEASGPGHTAIDLAEQQLEMRQNLLVEELGSLMRAAVAFFPKSIARDGAEAKAFFDTLLRAASLPPADNNNRLKAISETLAALDSIGLLNGGASWAAKQRTKLTDLRMQQEWLGEFARAVESKAGPRSAELLQRDLERRTRILGAKVEVGLRMFANAVPDIQKAADAIKTGISTQAVPAQLTAANALQKKSWKPAGTSQEKASQGLASASRACTELVRLAAEEMKKNPPPPPVAGEAGEPPTLASLLAMFEQEDKEGEGFTLPEWKLNIQLNKDWLSQCKNGSGAGAGAPTPGKPGEKPGEKPGDQPSEKPGDQPDEAMREKLKAAAEQARSLAAAAAKAQQEANEQAKALALSGNKDELSTPGSPNAPKSPRKDNWNKLPSELTRNIRQQQDAPPPEEYRHAVETYFRRIGLDQPQPQPQPVTPAP